MQRIVAIMSEYINYTSSTLGGGGKDPSTIPTAIVVDKISTTIAGNKTALTVVYGGGWLVVKLYTFAHCGVDPQISEDLITCVCSQL
jgi:hypothetical protein